MKYLSICSGIEAASVAWHPLGWEAVAFSEVDKFPSAVLAHHYQGVPNLGDMTRWREWPDEILVEADVLVGGTPCQAFSVAGLRRSLDDERGNLTLIFLEIANAIDDLRRDSGKPPVIIVWENVPGVFTIDKDNPFGCFLAGLAGSFAPISQPQGRSWTDAGVVSGPRRSVAWRVLDAQYFSLAQRRRRVFVVASAGDFSSAEALFPVGESVRRDSAPRRGEGQVAPTIPARSLGGGGLGTDFDCDRGVICMASGQANAEIDRDMSSALNCNRDGAPIVCARESGQGFWTEDAVAGTLDANMGMSGHASRPAIICATEKVATAVVYHCADCCEYSPSPVCDWCGSSENSSPVGPGDPCAPVCATGQVTHALTARHDSSEAGCGRGTPVVAFNWQNGGGYKNSNDGLGISEDHSPPLGCSQTPAVAFAQNQRDEVRQLEVAGALAAEPGMKQQTYIAQPALYSIMPMNSGKDYKAREVDVAQPLMTSPVGGNQGGDYVVSSTVRRLTPVECERLQGFPDNYTRIAYRNKPADKCPDGPRYKALGNSMAVPVMAWIGKRIQEVANE